MTKMRERAEVRWSSWGARKVTKVPMRLELSSRELAEAKNTRMNGESARTKGRGGEGVGRCWHLYLGEGGGENVYKTHCFARFELMLKCLDAHLYDTA